MAEGKGEEPQISLDDEDGAEETKGKKGLIFIIIGVVVLLLLGGGAFFMMSGGEEPAADAHTEEAATDEHGEDAEESHGDSHEKKDGHDTAETGHGAASTAPVFYEMTEFLVDLNNSGRGKNSFLKMKVTLQLSSPEQVKVVEAKMPIIRNNFVTYLRELRASDLSGSAGLFRLREELLLRINQDIAPDEVTNILFAEAIVQ